MLKEFPATHTSSKALVVSEYDIFFFYSARLKKKKGTHTRPRKRTKLAEKKKRRYNQSNICVDRGLGVISNAVPKPCSFFFSLFS